MSAAPNARPCPGCGTPVVWGPDAPFRPFCSERCRIADLAAWASERYRVPAVDPPDDEPTPDPS
ncbi:MAG TPA: DNA gyrase inhibitor YacG [Casimicrobiaceae bacterium]|jgi:endogenous inhibitor of DNA gyrase (YacG/DUF329 family)|nr:DNA gyrase inhibitor YacG [Casimicrobiaceae bacterium]